MTPQEMEAVLERLDHRLSRMDIRLERVEVSVQNLDRRTTSIEQILPTLATKQDLAGFRDEIRDEMRKLNQETAETVRHEARLLYEDLRDDIRILAEHSARDDGRASDS